MFRRRALLDAGKPQSEDMLGVSETAAWVIDGATSKGDTKYSPAQYRTDAVWFSRELNRYLHRNADDTERTLQEIVRDATVHCRDEYNTLRGGSGGVDDPLNSPAATFAMVRWGADHLEYYVVCDSSIIIDTEQGTRHITQPGPRPHNKRVTEKMAAYADERDIDVVDAREPVLPLLKDIDRTQNTPEGFWILDPLTLDPVYNATQGRLPLDTVQTLLLFTDGFEPLVDGYGLYEDWETVHSRIQSDGLRPLLDELRQYETVTDPGGNQSPRTKQLDDVGVIHLTTHATPK